MKKIFIAACTLFLWNFGHAQFITNSGLPIVNKSLVSTNGSWDNQGYMLNNGTIKSSAYFMNMGTLDTASFGGFDFHVTENWGFHPGGTHIGFLIKSGSGNIVSTVGLHVKDSLILKGGKWILNNQTDTVSIHEQCLVKAADTAFIEGMISRSGKGILLFPFGKHNIPLPLTVHKASAEKITASVATAPDNYTAGAGINALIDFPYVWNVKKKNATDTAAFIEVSYPNSLAMIDDPVIAKATPGNTYVSMGARLIAEDTLNRVTVRSYSRGLMGSFTIARGFAVDGKTDSLALVALYENTGGPLWQTQGNWLAGPIDTWAGVKRAGQSVVSVNLEQNQLTGQIPDVITDLQGLQRLDISDNAVVSIPDLSEIAALDTLDVGNNKMTFASLEPNVSIPWFTYGGQAPFGDPMDSLVAVGTPITFTLSAGGDSTTYQWKYNGSPINGAVSESYAINAVSRVNMGDYVLEATNTQLPELTLTSTAQHLAAYATISGKLLINEATGASEGVMTLLHIKQDGYDSTSIPVDDNGNYFFDKVILDDYLLVGFADTISHEGALPTYFDQKLFWEEADTIFLNENRGVDIVSEFEPVPSTGSGIINGILQEDDGTSGRKNESMANKRVAGAGVSARKVERGGRTREDNLVLVSYVFTNDNGEFAIKGLPEGEYRLNIQYPGFPMDTTSDITINIGGPLESVVSVEANVLEGKINVRKLTVTGIRSAEDYHVELYPNPAVEEIRLRFASNSAKRTIEMFSAEGGKLISQSADDKEADINVRQLPKGLYILKVLDRNKSVKTFKVVIE